MKKVKVKDLVIGRVYDIYYKGKLIVSEAELGRASKFFYDFSESYVSQKRMGVIRKEEAVMLESSFPYNFPSVHTALSFNDSPLELKVRVGEKANIQHLEFHEYVDENIIKELAEREAKLLKELAEVREAQKRQKFSF